MFISLVVPLPPPIIFIRNISIEDHGAEILAKDGLSELSNLRILTLSLMKSKIGLIGVRAISQLGFSNMMYLTNLVLNLS